MKKYKILIEETISDEFEVEAENEEEALRIARRKYDDCDFVLSPGNLLSKDIKVIKE